MGTIVMLLSGVVPVPAIVVPCQGGTDRVVAPGGSFTYGFLGPQFSNAQRDRNDFCGGRRKSAHILPTLRREWWVPAPVSGSVGVSQEITTGRSATRL